MEPTKKNALSASSLLPASLVAGAKAQDRAPPPPSLNDEFTSLSLHYRPNGHDIWGLIARSTPKPAEPEPIGLV
jgi:hypothetical protein